MSVVAGTASQATNGATTTITTSTSGTILNWQQFSIAAGETVRFNQPSSSAAVLNRVTGFDPSLIYGRLSSNGQIWLINPAGIVVGATGRIDVARFVASTLAISDADVLAGKWNFNGSNAASSISNAGVISVGVGGSIYLIAPNVENSAGGVLSAPDGQVMLLAGHTVTLASTATPGVYYEVSAPDTTAVNLGQVTSRDILLQGGAVRNGGVISADSVVQEGGRIFLKATRTATLDAGASLSANGTAGGVVAMEGETVTAAGNISATGSGGAGGTAILNGTPDIRQSAGFDVSGTAPGTIVTSALANEFDGSAGGWMVSDGWTNGGFFNSVWQAGNGATAGGELNLSITPCVTNCLSMPYASGESMSISRLGYGTYSAKLKAASGSGVVTSLFTYNANPWDEIDVEILGKDTTKVQFNYFKNGVGGHEQLVDLGFDAAAGYHEYSIKWVAGNISWYVDGVLKSQVSGNNLPSMPGRAMVNLWPATGVDAWTGPYAGAAATANYQYVRYAPAVAGLPIIKPTGMDADFSVPAVPAAAAVPAVAETLAGVGRVLRQVDPVGELSQAEIAEIMALQPDDKPTEPARIDDQTCTRKYGVLVCLRRAPENRLTGARGN